MNGNIFNGQQNQPNGYYQYPYTAAMPTSMRQEVPAYMMPQATAPAFIKGRPVSSFEEARVAQIDLDGSIFMFPDLGNKKIYTKRINADGTATINTYVLDVEPNEELPKYATAKEVQDLRDTLEEILAKSKNAAGVVTPTGTQAKLNF